MRGNIAYISTLVELKPMLSMPLKKRKHYTKSSSKNKPKLKAQYKTHTKSIFRTRDTGIYQEAFGLLLFAVGVMAFLAILTYSQTDPVLSSTTANNQYRVQNLLGIVGASLAQPVFEYTLGYASLIFPILLMMYGIFLMLDRGLETLRWFTFLSLSWAYFFSIVMAMPESLSTRGFSQNYYPSGLIGALTADLIARYLGRFALAFLSTVFLLILLMLTFEFRISSLPGAFGAGIQQIAASIRQALEPVRSWFLSVMNWYRRIPWLPERPDSPAEVRPSPRPAPDDEPLAATFDELSKKAYNEERQVETFSGFEDVSLDSDVSARSAGEQMPATGVSSTFKAEQVPPDPEDSLSPTAHEYPLPGTLPPVEDDGGEIPFIAQIEELPSPELIEAENYDELVRQAAASYQMPPLDLLDEDETQSKISREELMANADRLENTLATFNVKAFVKKVIEGPVITLYAVRPAEGVKISQITNLADDLALAMKAKGIRMIAPIPGEAAIGIEIPNRKPSIVYFKSIVRSEKFRNHPGQLVIGMGKTIGGETFCADLTRMPHLLIAGATGSGKSVGINTIIASIIYRVPPGDVKFVMIDPKKLELTLYGKLKDHYLAYCPDIDEMVITHPQNAILILRSVVNEMEERYDILAKAGVRDIISYNKKVDKIKQTNEKSEFRRLPYIIVIIDELADLILTASREVEEPITRLAQMARAVGIHLIVATQRPSVDILTGLIKANFPTRIAYQVATRPDSKVILDMYGAEKLIGNGDMLYLPPGTGKPVRLQNPFISTEEVERMIKHVRKQPKFPPYELRLIRERSEPSAEATKMINRDDLFEQAKEIVIRHQQGSTSLLQRKLNIGYARAGRLMDALEEAGIVGPSQGSKAREVLVTSFGDNGNNDR